MADEPAPDDEPAPPPPGPVEQVRGGLRRHAGLVAEGLVLVAAFSWMLWVRLRSLEGMHQYGTVLFSGTDPYYHFRNLVVALHNFPASMAFDPWTRFPTGTHVPGQFGTLFETVLAGALLVAHGGAVPDLETARAWAATYPAVLGALAVVPVYLVVRLATNRVGAVYSALALSLLSGAFLRRSLAGVFDHHVAEVLLSTLAAAGLLAALRVARRHAPALEGLRRPLPRSLDEARDRWADLPRRPLLATLGAGAGAGVLLGIYVLTWNYGVLFVIIFDLFAVLSYVLAVRADRPTDDYALAMVPMYLVGATLLLTGMDSTSFELHRQSLLQPAVLALSAAGVLVLQALRDAPPLLADRGLPVDEVPDGALYAVLLAATTLLGAGLVALVLPDLYHTVAVGWDWVVGAGEGSRVKTIAEARTLGWEGLVEQVSWMAYPAVVAVAVAGWRAWEAADPAPALLLAWGGTILVATLSQVRFSYYAGVATVVLNGYLVGELADISGLAQRVQDAIPSAPPAGDDVSQRASTAGQVVGVLAVAVFLLPGLVFASDDPPRQSWKVGENIGPGEAAEWHPGLVWLRENTPAIPDYSLSTPYPSHPGYGEGAYGVLSWWDYGHWIQATGERPPVANPFQQGAPFASRYFTSTADRSEQLLRDHEGDQRVRYVVIDDAMATGKFGAITVWAERTDLNRPSANRTYTIRDQQVDLPVLGEPYDNTTLARLYFEDGDGMTRYRLVHELTGGGEFRFVGNVLQVSERGGRIACLNQVFPSRRCPVQPAGQDVIQRIEDDDPIPVQSFGGDQVGYAWDVHYVSPLKIFERVEGAVLEGEAPAGANVTASLRLNSDDFRRFGYTRTTSLAPGSGNATYRLQVSYASGPPQGEANRTVRAEAPYTVTVTGPEGNQVAQHQVEVPDEAVLEGHTIRVDGSG